MSTEEDGLCCLTCAPLLDLLLDSFSCHRGMDSLRGSTTGMVRRMSGSKAVKLLSGLKNLVSREESRGGLLRRKNRVHPEPEGASSLIGSSSRGVAPPPPGVGWDESSPSAAAVEGTGSLPLASHEGGLAEQGTQREIWGDSRMSASIGGMHSADGGGAGERLNSVAPVSADGGGVMAHIQMLDDGESAATSHLGSRLRSRKEPGNRDGFPLK